MNVRNRHGDPVDPVPFLVCTATAVMLQFSVGPLHGPPTGFPPCVVLPSPLVSSSRGTLRTDSVWPAAIGHGAPELRFQRLIYIGVGFAVLLVAVSAPLAL
ncbi:hypothetical protein C8039_13695 [Halogeometricum sp. wsp3]|nr:hypothetical protein C8039_13695 [Halogeometricum sp. wsp3]